jgi:hypothetical protein
VRWQNFGKSGAEGHCDSIMITSGSTETLPVSGESHSPCQPNEPKFGHMQCLDHASVSNWLRPTQKKRLPHFVERDLVGGCGNRNGVESLF